MAANTAPIYTKRAKIKQGVTLKAADTTYDGSTIETREVFDGDDAEGMFIERLRFKALGTNVQTVARIWLNQNGGNQTWSASAPTPSGTPSGTGGTILAGTQYARIIAFNEKGERTAVGTASSSVVTTGSTSSISWTWTAVAGASKYWIYIGPSATAQTRYFEVTTNSYTQVQPHAFGVNDDPLTGSTWLYGEITLPATTASNTAATPDIDYYMNLPVPPGTEVYVSIATAVAAGWHVTPIGGIY